MGGSLVGHLTREPRRSADTAREAAPSRTFRTGQDWLLSLQRSVGNQAVTRLLQADDSSPAMTLLARSPGQPLGPGVRELMEARLGHDLSGVRIHNGPEAALAARAVNATAFTVGYDIVLGANAPSPQNRDGWQLLAHELAHVVQQRGQPETVSALEVSQAGSQAELEATEAAVATADGRLPRLHGQPMRIYRQQQGSAGTTQVPTFVSRVVFLDANVFLEVARGNANVAQVLRAAAADPQIRLVTGRGIYTELTRLTGSVTVNQVAALRAMADKLHIEVLDAGLLARLGTYETYATYEQSARFAADPGAFAHHGELSLSGRPGAKKERETLKDLPHIAEAKAAGAEIWSSEAQVQRSARALGVSVAPESRIQIPRGERPATEENILRLIPEVRADDLPRYGGTVRRPPGGSGGTSGTSGTPGAGIPGPPLARPPSPAPPKAAPPGQESAAPSAAAAPVATPLKASASAVGGAEMEGTPLKVPSTAGAGEEIEIPEVSAGRAAGIGTGIAAFQIALMLLQFIPDPLERNAIRQGMANELSSSRAQDQFGKLRPLVQQSPTALYYSMKFKVNYSVTQHWHYRATPMYQVRGVELLEIGLSKDKIETTGKLDPPSRPAGLELAGGIQEYSWAASRVFTTSVLPLRPEIGPTYGLRSDTEIRKAIKTADGEVVGRIPIEERIRIISQLFSGWVSDDDIETIRKIYRNTPSAQRPAVIRVVQGQIQNLLSIGQRTQLRAMLVEMQAGK